MDLDRLFQVQENPRYLDPIDVIDEMLVSDRSKRTCQTRPARFDEFDVGDKVPSGVCPKCRQYVANGCKGVLCTGCHAYWHYECASVSDEILSVEWDGIDFQCEKHKTTVTIQQGSDCKNIDILFSEVRIKSFNLNVKEKLKEKLQNIGSDMIIEKHDGGRQYTVRLNTVSYQMIAQNMLTLGNELGGVEVKNNDVDLNGTGLQCQYIIEVSPEMSASITCYHTKSSMLVQLVGRKSEKKVEKLRQFIYGSFSSLILSIEKFPKYPLLKDKMRQEIEAEIMGYVSENCTLQGDKLSNEMVTVNSAINYDTTPNDSGVEVESANHQEKCQISEDERNLLIEKNSESEEVSKAVRNDGEGTDEHNVLIKENSLSEEVSKAVVLIEKPRNEVNKKKILQSFNVLKKEEQ